MSKRALRRHHSIRMKAKARRVAAFSWGYSISNQPLDRIEMMMRYAERNCNHLARCSGYCCGNPRKWFKDLKLQEIKFNIIANEQESDY